MERKNERPGGSRGAMSFRHQARRLNCRASAAKVEAIYRLARLDWKIFPIAPRSKMPLIRWTHGVAFDDTDFEQRFECHLDEKATKLKANGKVLRDRSPRAHLDLFRASDDIAMIDLWVEQWPKAGFAVACGPSNLLVLDIDRHGDVDGVDACLRLQDRFGKLPVSPLQQTGGGGFQLFFAMSAEVALGNSCSKLGPGLDTRGKGGMAIIPPSVHPSGKAYRWKADREPWTMPPAELPTWMIDLLRHRDEPSHPQPNHAPMSDVSRTNYSARALMAELEHLRQAKQGERNHVLNRVSFTLGQLAAIGFLAEDATLTLIAGAALSIGLPEREIARTMRSGWERGLSQPREIR